VEPEPGWGPGGGQEQPGEQRRVAVGFAVVGGAGVGDVGGGGREDVVVDVGVGEGGVGVLVEAVEEEDEAEGDGGGEDEGGREEGGHCGRGSGVAGVGTGIASIAAYLACLKGTHSRVSLLHGISMENEDRAAEKGMTKAWRLRT